MKAFIFLTFPRYYLQTSMADINRDKKSLNHEPLTIKSLNSPTSYWGLDAKYIQIQILFVNPIRVGEGIGGSSAPGLLTPWD